MEKFKKWIENAKKIKGEFTLTQGGTTGE